MKNILMFIVLILVLSFLSSCGVYEKPCEGVTQVKDVSFKS